MNILTVAISELGPKNRCHPWALNQSISGKLQDLWPCGFSRGLIMLQFWIMPPASFSSLKQEIPWHHLGSQLASALLLLLAVSSFPSMKLTPRGLGLHSPFRNMSGQLWGCAVCLLCQGLRSVHSPTCHCGLEFHRPECPGPPEVTICLHSPKH